MIERRSPGRAEPAAQPQTEFTKTSVVLDLTPRAEELFGTLFADCAVDLEHVHACMKAWVARQDALDRKRNHFLKDFRGVHGMDRRAYSPSEREEYETGLERVNAQVSVEREAAAAKLLTGA